MFIPSLELIVCMRWFRKMIIFNGGHEGINAFFVGKKWLSTMRSIGNTPPTGERIGSFSINFC